VARALDEDDAMRWFSARAADARGEEVVTPSDDATIRAIVTLLGRNKVAILLAAARAERETPNEILESLHALEGLSLPEAPTRRALATGESVRREGRLEEAERHLQRVAKRPQGDLFAEAEALRLLGAVYRAEGRLAEALATRERALGLHEKLGGRAQVAVAWGDVGTSLASLGRLHEARTFHERAIAAHRDLGREREEGVEWSYLGVALHRAGRFGDAKRAHERALEIHARSNHPRGEGADRMHLGYVLHELGRLVEGRESYAQALRIFRRVKDRSLEGVTLSYLGALEVEAKRPEEAGAMLEQALAIHREVKSKRHEAVTRLHLAQHHRSLGEAKRAREAAKRAVAVAPDAVELEHRAWALALAGDLDEAIALELEDEVTRDAIALLGLADRVRAHEASVDRARSSALEARGLEAVPSGSRRRLALAELEAALHRELPALVIAADGSRFVAPKGKLVELGRRTPLIRVLRHLLERRLAAPGEPSAAEALLAAGWPGERVLYEPGQVRVRNVLAQLRKLGLRSTIVTRGGGYLLDPAFPVRTSL
jgi:tetratricopeptide (TPR) repeat protein